MCEQYRVTLTHSVHSTFNAETCEQYKVEIDPFSSLYL